MGEYFCDICKFYDDDVSSKFVICCHTCIVPTNQCIFLHLLCGTDREIGVPLQRLWHMQGWWQGKFLSLCEVWYALLEPI